MNTASSGRLVRTTGRSDVIIWNQNGEGLRIARSKLDGDAFNSESAEAKKASSE